MESQIIIYICGTILIISILVLIFANYWVCKYYNYLKRHNVQKRISGDKFYKELSEKIDSLIYIQNETIELFRKDNYGH